jgi:hypothetical protein
MSTKTLLNAVTANGSGSWVTVSKNISHVIAKMAAVAGAGCTVTIEGTPDGGTNVATLATLTPTGSGGVSASTITTAPMDIRATLSGLTGDTGTGLSVTCKIRF